MTTTNTDEPPPLRSAAGGVVLWGAVAAVGGVACFALPPHVLPIGVPEPPYGHPLIPWLAFAYANVRVLPTAAAFLVLGVVLGVAQPRRPFLMAVLSVSLLFVLHCVNIYGDTRVDPTDHNLLPFEFVILGGIALPVLPGVFVAAFARRHSSKSD
jgi:hypothetical protein